MKPTREHIRRLNIVINALDRLYETGAKWQGIKTNTLHLLYALDNGQEHTQKTICEEWGIPRTTLNTIIKECQRQGYLTLQPIPGCKRDLRISLTPQGAAFAQQLLAPVYQAEQTALRQTLREYGPDFIAALDQYRQHLARAFEKMEEL